MIMADSFVFPLRTIHLDFHTGPAIPDVGRDFNSGQFAQTFKKAHVDSVTVFAKCHHGHLYYNTDHPARHPSLPAGLDLLGEQIEALHSAGIRAPIYISVQCDEYAANTHPEWIALTPDLRHVKRGNSAFTPGWQILDMSSPYQDYLADQVAEVLRKFAPVDGIFLDMCWDQPSCSRWAIDGMRQRGLDPQAEADRARYARAVVHDYMARFRAMVDEAQRGHAPAGIWFNSRPKTSLFEETKYLRHIEIEALPTGGWGYAYFPYVARFVRPLGLPTLSHTGRFHKSWGDNGGLKPRAALLYECCQILSQGLTLGIGDLLPPRGAPQAAVYELIGSVYEYIEACQPFVLGARHLSEVALIINPQLGDNPGPAGLGAVRALQQLRQQFDLVPPGADLGSYRLVIVPETTRIDAALKANLVAYLAAGGALIVAGPAALDETGSPIMDELGIAVQDDSPYSHVFLRPLDEIKQGMADFDTVMYERGFRMTPIAPATALCQVVEPYFERAYDHFSGHDYTPEADLSPYAAAVQNGRVITLAVPLLEAFGKHANVAYRQILGNCIRRLLPRPLIRDGGPAHLEATAVRKGDTTIVHLVSFLPSRQANDLDLVTDAFPLVNMPIAVRLDQRPRRALLQPQGQEVPFNWQDGYAETSVTLLNGHAMLVFE
jgi:hypothetical protein